MAPNVIPSGFVDGKVASEKILAALELGDNYRIGHTKVFFKAGILGQLEEMREEKLSKILSNFQARVRGYLMRGKYGKLQDQRYRSVRLNPLKPNSSNCYTLPSRSNLPFLISDIRALWRSALSARVPECQKLEMVS